MKILHLSDLHIGGEDELLKSDKKDDSPCTRRCQEIFNRMMAGCKPNSDYVVIITGDITDGGSMFFSGGIGRQYETAKGLIDLLREKGFTVLPVPGNHDYGCMGTHPKKKYGQFFRKQLLFDYQGAFPILGRAEAPGLINDVAFIGLNSMEAAFDRDYYLGAQGKLGKGQLKRLGEMLDSNEVKNASARVVYLHHHPFSPKRNMELHDADGLKKVLNGRKVDALLFGHNHNGWKWNGWWGIKRCYEAGTSTRKEGRAGYHRIMDLNRKTIKDYDGDFFGNLKTVEVD